MFRTTVLALFLTAPLLLAQQNDPYMAAYVDARKDIDAGKLDVAQKKLENTLQAVLQEPNYPPPNIALLHYELGEIFLMQDDYKRAEKAYAEALTIRLKALGLQNVSTSNALDRLGQVLVPSGRYDAAEKLLLQALEVRVKLLKSDHYLLGRSYDNLAALYSKNGQTAKAEQYYEKSIEHNVASVGADTIPVVKSLRNYSDFLINKARYRDAEKLVVRSLEIADKQPNKNSLSMHLLYEDMGLIQSRLGRYAEAGKYFTQAVRFVERTRGKDTPTYARAINNLGQLYAEVGRVQEAEELTKQAYEFCVRTLGKEHPDTLTMLENLSGVHAKSGAYTQAESELQTCVKATEARLGSEHPRLAFQLNQLGNLYFDMILYDKAIATHRRALAIREKSLGEKHTATAQSYTNLANAYVANYEHAKAKEHYERALEILQSGNSKESIQFAALLTSIYRLNIDMNGKVDLGMLERAAKIYSKQYGDKHPLSAALQYNLGYGYYSAREYTKAEPIFRQTFKVIQAGLGETHPSAINPGKMLALTQYSLNDRETALQTMDDVRRKIRFHVTNVLPGLSQNDQQTFIKGTDEYALFQAMTMGLENADKPNFVETAATWLVNGKGSLHETQAATVQLTAAGNSPQVQKLREVRQEIASLTLTINAEEDGQTAKKREKLLDQEKELTAAIRDAGGRLAKITPWVESKDIRGQLEKGSVLIDIVRFNVARLKPVVGQTPLKEAHYAAWITPKEGAVRVVDLGPADEIDKTVLAVRNELKTAVDTIKRLGEPNAEKQFKATLNAAAIKVLHPLLKEIGTANNLIISPDGDLWVLPWAALPLPDGQYLAEKFTINHVVSGRDLLVPKDAAANAKRVTAPLIIAAPDFNMTPEEALQEAQRLITGLLPKGIDSRALAKSLGLGNVKSLEGTATEADAITPLLEKLYGKPRVHTDREALKSLVTTVKSPQALILSTHGFFKDDQKLELSASNETLDPSRSLRSTNTNAFEDPLTRCGLLFAGCNKVGTTTGAVVENGILTGSEVVNTDLRGTKLVVLSACETGLGKVNNGEGVAGLRQAFQLAGAECVVATLWQVPDNESAQLMKAFFNELVEQKARDQALSDAQRFMIQQRRDRFGAAHPYYWAAYTVTGRVR